MGEIVRLAGVEDVTYEKDGKKGSFTRLHFLYPEGAAKGVEGCKVESVFLPREVDKKTLLLGRSYELVYQLYDTRNGKSARLVGMNLLEE